MTIFGHEAYNSKIIISIWWSYMIVKLVWSPKLLVFFYFWKVVNVRASPPIWTDATDDKHFFQRITDKEWVEFYNKIHVNKIGDWTGVSKDVRKQEVTLRLNNKPNVFIKLTPTALLFGKTATPNQRIVSGKWTFR